MIKRGPAARTPLIQRPLPLTEPWFGFVQKASPPGRDRVAEARARARDARWSPAATGEKPKPVVVERLHRRRRKP